jgi:hypothetical protein
MTGLSAAARCPELRTNIVWPDGTAIAYDAPVKFGT